MRINATLLQLIITTDRIMTSHTRFAARLFAFAAWQRLLIILPALVFIWLLTGWALA